MYKPVQLARVQIVEEGEQFALRVHVFKPREQVHVAERVDSDQRQVFLRLAQMVQWMGEAFAVGRQEIDVFCITFTLEQMY